MRHGLAARSAPRQRVLWGARCQPSLHTRLLALALAVSGCGLRAPCTPAATDEPTTAPAASGTRSAVVASASAVEARDPVAAPASWIAAVRCADWAAAARELDALPAAERLAPELRYVRARAAVELGEPSVALELVAGLGDELPILAQEIGALEATAALAAGDAAKAIERLGRRTDAEGLLELARAHELAEQLDRAREVVSRAIARLVSDRQSAWEQAPARALAARLALAQGDHAAALVAFRWLALEAPEHPLAAGADAKLTELDPRRALTRAERQTRAMSFARAGLIEATEAELAQQRSAAGAPVAEAEQLFARALARYGARQQLSEAAALFQRSAAASAHRRPRALLYAARSYARQHDAARAIDAYRELVRRFPDSREGSEARFQIARQYYLLGAWGDAITAYGGYLARHGKSGDSVETARYERGVAYLVSGELERAERTFAALGAGQPSALLRASYRELRAVALEAAGKREEAARELRAVIDEEPLSLAALLAAERLRSYGLQPPSPIEAAAPVPPASPLELTLPSKVALLGRLGLDAAAEAELVTHEEALRRIHGPRANEALCQAYGTLSVAARRYSIGRRAAADGALQRAPTARSRWLWECLHPRPHAELVARLERSERLPVHLIHAVMRQESGFRPAVASPARAVGLMQLIPPTATAVARELELEHRADLLRRPDHNLRLGARYLRRVLDRFGDHPVLAVAAYNAGPQAVSHWLESGETLPLDLFIARIPFHETRVYVHRVLGNLARYAYLAGGEAALPRFELELPRGLRASAEDY